jgi:hypothetical protein
LARIGAVEAENVDIPRVWGRDEFRSLKMPKGGCDLTQEINVSLTPEIAAVLKIATEFTGLRTSQFGRQAIIEKLVRDQFMQHPMAKYMTAAKG